MNKFIKFGIVGIGNTAITIISFSLLVKLGMFYIMANIISYSLGVINSYIWNKKWVFKYGGNGASVFIRFIVVNLIVLAFNTLSLFILVDMLNVNVYISQIFAIGLGMMINFLLNQKWTFAVGKTNE